MREVVVVKKKLFNHAIAGHCFEESRGCLTLDVIRR